MKAIKTVLRRVLPPGVRRRLRHLYLLALSRPWTASREQVFGHAYRRPLWGSRESASGTGSELRATVRIRRDLPRLLKRHGVQTMVDAPCGDWNWMSHLELPIAHYVGLDIVPELIRSNQSRFGSDRIKFLVSDMVIEPPPRADLILCRDCLVHLSNQDIASVLGNFKRSGSTLLLTNTYADVAVNRDQSTGLLWRRIDLGLPPFNFPEPLEVFPDGEDVDPNTMGLWRLADLTCPNGE